jgi:hypothetical protein
VSQFEYLAVFISIIFGIAVTHIMAGVMRSLYRGERDVTHVVFAAFMFFTLSLNWWTSFRWAGNEVWSIEIFIVIILWAMMHYVAAIALYPPLSAGTEQPFEYRRRWFLIAVVSAGLLDIVHTWLLGKLLDPVTYLPFVLHYILLCGIAIGLQREVVYRWLAWYLLVSLLAWAFVVRRFIG